MSWDYRITERAIKQLRKLGPKTSRRVLAFLDERIPCRIDDVELVVLVVKIALRSDAYK